MNQLLKENYQADVNRGLITKETTDLNFLNKLKSGTVEVQLEFPITTDNVILNKERLFEEIADCLNVCNNWLIHRGQDPEYWLTVVLKKNKKRVKKSK